MSASTLGAALDSAFCAARQRTAVVDDAGAYTFAELSRAVHTLAAQYRRLGVQQSSAT